MPTYSFSCEICNNYFEEWFHISDMPDELPCPCGAMAQRIIAYAPALQSTQLDTSFKPHYDGQLGQHFQSADQKKQWLKANGYTQVSGPLSPQKDQKGNFRCTESQAQPLITKKPTSTQG